jgi:hypothetical protein
MRKEAKCGQPLGTHKNRTKNAARAELTIEHLEGVDGCEGVSVWIYNDKDEKPLEVFGIYEAGGPDLYEVPAGGRLEFRCGTIESDPPGKCRARWTLRWI